jgi:hypothetical protein
MTYQEVAQNLIDLYAKYVEVCTANEEDYINYSDDLVIAVEALLIRADQEKRKSMDREVLSQLKECYGVVNPAVQQMIDEEMAFENHLYRLENVQCLDFILRFVFMDIVIPALYRIKLRNSSKMRRTETITQKFNILYPMAWQALYVWNI